MGSYRRDIYVRVLLDGGTPEEAAAEAGYTPKYGRQLANTPEVQRAIERRREYDARRAAAADEDEPLTPSAILREMAYDGTLDPRVRIQAIRVLGMLEKENGGEAARIPPVIIVDDIPETPAAGKEG